MQNVSSSNFDMAVGPELPTAGMQSVNDPGNDGRIYQENPTANDNLHEGGNAAPEGGDPPDDCPRPTAPFQSLKADDLTVMHKAEVGRRARELREAGAKSWLCRTASQYIGPTHTVGNDGSWRKMAKEERSASQSARRKWGNLSLTARRAAGGRNEESSSG